jgi:hypothetical protein
MRACLALGLLMSAASAMAQAQPKETKAVNAAAILAALQTEVPVKPFAEPIKFKDFLDELGRQLPKNNVVTIAVDEQAFRDEIPDAPDFLEVEVRIRSLSAKMSAMNLLREAIKALPKKAAMIVRAGKVEIVPIERTSKEYMLNQTFNVDFKDRPLAAALEDLSEITGVTIVVDARTKTKGQTQVTARFRDDVALQDAVRMLADMADLKMVYLVTGIYITTPEHALEVQKELKQLYEGQNLAPAPLQPNPGMVGMVGMVGGGPPPDLVQPSSPLAPPLPPRMKPREAGAFLWSLRAVPSLAVRRSIPRFAPVEFPRLEAAKTPREKHPDPSSLA